MGRPRWTGSGKFQVLPKELLNRALFGRRLLERKPAYTLHCTFGTMGHADQSLVFSPLEKNCDQERKTASESSCSGRIFRPSQIVERVDGKMRG
jgi:hypothetical protein